MPQIKRQPKLFAILGSTNTGKTFVAIKRMLKHRTGIMGFPLRLLARENYEKVCSLIGKRNVALLTGEEKIVPKTARFFLCTVEAMPLDRVFEFVGVDEIQLCADKDRGYVFSDRLLRARGTQETLFLGATTMRPILEKLLPDVEIKMRRRLSKLNWDGTKKLSRIPRRSAVIAFSVGDVYSLAEGIRQSRGGTAVVLGALSPRTRNAQVEMYQAGEVDYLVATDAIGLGLNMDIDHVVFSSLQKFDGCRMRYLDVQEISQIAGRAGRYTRNGTFSTLTDIGPLKKESIYSIENHIFSAVQKVWWRNPKLEYCSLLHLQKSLEEIPPTALMMRAGRAEDHLSLQKLVRMEDVRKLASDRQGIRLLWEVCQIPDFRQAVADAHIHFLRRVYGFLCSPHGRLPFDWVARQLDYLDREDGDIDTLMARLSHTRTWTYIANRGDWITDAAYWKDRARNIEEKLSDSLHRKLTERFVDRRSTLLVKAQKNLVSKLSVAEDGTVMIGGQVLGAFSGLCFKPENSYEAHLRRLAVNTVRRGLSNEVTSRVFAITKEENKNISLTQNGKILWQGQEIGYLSAGAKMLSPSVRVKKTDLISVRQRLYVEKKLHVWLQSHLKVNLGTLVCLQERNLTGAARGLVYQLAEGLGSLPNSVARNQLLALNSSDKEILREMGVKIGCKFVYLPKLQKPNSLFLKAALWAAHTGATNICLPDPGKVAPKPMPGYSETFYRALGFFPVGNRVIRVDILDKLVGRLMHLSRLGIFELPYELASTLGLKKIEIPLLMRALGYKEAGGVNLYKRGLRGKKVKMRATRNKGQKSPKIDPTSPFAALKNLHI